MDSAATVQLMAPAGSPGVQLECIGCTSAPPNASESGPVDLSLNAAETSQPPEVEIVKDGVRYVVQAPATFKSVGAVPMENGAVSLAPGQSIDVTIPESTVVRHKTVEVQPNLVPAAAGPEVKVVVSKPGKPLDVASWKAEVRGCFVPIGGRVGRPLPVVRVESTELGVAVVTLRAPDDLFASGASWLKGGDARFLVYDISGYSGEGSLTSWRPWVAMAVSLAFAAAVFAGLAFAAKSAAEGLGTGYKVFLLGLFTSRDGDASLSLFQVFLWTVVTVWALSYVFLRTSDVLTLTPQIMVLLGFASVASVSARWIATSRAAGAEVESKSVPEFWAMLVTDGKPDLLKVQLFAFTVLGAAYVVWTVATSTAFPVLDDNLLLLMGVSNLAYVGGKLADQPSVYDKASVLNQKRVLIQREQELLTAELAKKKGDKTVESAKPVPDTALLNQLTTRIEEIEGTGTKGGLLADLTKQLTEIEKEMQELIKQMK